MNEVEARVSRQPLEILERKYQQSEEGVMLRNIVMAQTLNQ